MSDMVTSLLVALLGHSLMTTPMVFTGTDVWEETVEAQKPPVYHPMLKFGPQATFFFKCPAYVVEGNYQMTDGHYVFRPLTVIQLGQRELRLLLPEMETSKREQVERDYASSMKTFTADYQQASHSLLLNYPVGAANRSYTLYAYTEGDDQLSSVLNSDDRAVAGLWCAPEPFPEKLDARVRYKIGGIEGLQDFSREAKASDEAQFGLLDLRVDKSFRIHGKAGTWVRNGSTLKLFIDQSEIVFTISGDGAKLMIAGKKAYIR